MILTFKGPYGSIVDLLRDGEIQGYEFVEPPIEYRFLRAGFPISDWIRRERKRGACQTRLGLLMARHRRRCEMPVRAVAKRRPPASGRRGEK